MKFPNAKLIGLPAIALVVVASGGWSLFGKRDAAPERLQIAEPTDAKPAGGFTMRSTLSVPLPITGAVKNGAVNASFTGNGRERLTVTIKNDGPRPMRLNFPAGLIFKAAANSVVLVRARSFDVPAQSEITDDIQTAAMKSTNVLANAGYELTNEFEPKLGRLFDYLKDHPEVTPTAVQTAVLVINENLPLRMFAKFAAMGADVPSRYDSPVFKADTVEILSALTVLRAMGVPDDRLAITVDPQLKIEAMIDPLAHALALKYFGIADEWAFWKSQLLSGDASIRHYALYGIARFYPDIAIQMLPEWVRETRTDHVYRISAVQALAETQRVEALSALRQLSRELGDQTEIGRVAHIAADYLETRLNREVVQKVRFRFGEERPRFHAKASDMPNILAVANQL